MVLIKFYFFFHLTISSLLSINSSSQDLIIDKYLEKKIDNSINKVFNAFDLQYVLIKENKYRLIYEISNDKKHLGFFSLCRAKSMYDVFDYIIIYDAESKIKDIKIFRYNEDYGYEIAARWFLKQFFEKKAGEKMSYNYDIDGISGATISAKSVTSDIKKNSEEISKIVFDKYFNF